MYNGFDKDVLRKLLEEEFYKKDMNEVTRFLKNYIQVRPRYNEKKEVQCYNCQGFLPF